MNQLIDNFLHFLAIKSFIDNDGFTLFLVDLKGVVVFK